MYGFYPTATSILNIVVFRFSYFWHTTPTVEESCFSCHKKCLGMGFIFIPERFLSCEITMENSMMNYSHHVFHFDPPPWQFSHSQWITCPSIPAPVSSQLLVMFLTAVVDYNAGFRIHATFNLLSQYAKRRNISFPPKKSQRPGFSLCPSADVGFWGIVKISYI